MISPFCSTQQDAHDKCPPGAQSHKCDGFDVRAVVSGKTFQRTHDFTTDASVAEIHKDENRMTIIDCLDQLYRFIDQLREQPISRDICKIHQEYMLAFMVYELYLWHTVSYGSKGTRGAAVLVTLKFNKLKPSFQMAQMHLPRSAQQA
jgi:hypothetical protein